MAPSTVVLKNSNNVTVKTITNVPNGVQKTITGLAAGMYSLTATGSNGCSSTVPITVAAGANVLINGLSVNPIECNGGTTTVSFTVSGGTAPYLFCLVESNLYYSSCKVCNDGACNAVQTFTGVPAGNFELVVTDANGCFAAQSITITQPQPVNFTTHTSSQSCPRNSSQLTVTATGGTPPYSYQLNGGAFQNNGNLGCVTNGTKPTVTVKDANGCTKTAKVTVP